MSIPGSWQGLGGYKSVIVKMTIEAKDKKGLNGGNKNMRIFWAQRREGG